MASRCQVKSTRQFIIGYICSKCKSVNSSEGNLVIIGEAGSQRLAEKALNEAQQIAMKVLHNLHEKPVFVREEIENLKWGGSYGYYLRKMELPCPCCNNLEHWQIEPQGIGSAIGMAWDEELQRNYATGVPEESCPVLFDSPNSFESWRNFALTKQRIGFSQHWASNLQEMQNIREQIVSLDNQIRRLEDDKNTVSYPMKILQMQYEKKHEEAKKYPLFSGNRKAANAELKELKKQIQVQTDEVNKQIALISGKIKDAVNAKQSILVPNPGVTEQLQVYKSNQSSQRAAFRWN